MKKTLLASALLASISAYAAIPSDINERADLVQKRVEATTANVGKTYQTYLQASPLFNKVDVQLRDYVRKDAGATDKTAFVIDWNNTYFSGEAPPVKEIIFNSVIDYSDAVAQEGKLAVIKSEVDADALAQQLQISKDSKDFNTLSEVLKHLELNAILHDGDQYEQHVRIKPVDAKPEDGVHITYEGFDYKVMTTDADLAGGYGKSTIQSGKFEATNSQETNNGPKKITFLPFSGESEFRKNGDLTFQLAPFEFHADDLVIKAKDLDGKGKNMVFDPVLGSYLGEYRYTLNDIAVASAGNPEAVYVKSLAVKGENKKSGDLYHSDMGMEILPVKEAFAALTGGMSEALGVQSIHADFGMKNLSSQFMSDLTELQGEIQLMGQAAHDPAKSEAAKKVLFARGDSLLAEAGKHGAQLKFKLVSNNDAGNAVFDSWVEFLKGSKLTMAELDSAINAQDPSGFIALINQNLRFEVNITLPKALTDAVGVTPMIEGYAAGFLKLDGNNYKLVLKNDGKAITLNGEAFPPAM